MANVNDAAEGMPRTWHPLLEQRRRWSLDPAVAPALCRLVKLEREGDAVTALSLGGKRISFGESGERIARLLALMDGRRTIREIAAETDEELEELVEVVGQLYRVAAVWNDADCAV